MQTYGSFRPTGFDAAGAFLPEQQDWLVAPVSIMRDTDDPLSLSNWERFLEIIGGESDDVEVHRFGHWGPGWFELILIRPGSHAAVLATELEQALEDYPVVDEDHYSQKEVDMVGELWANATLRDRIGYATQAGYSAFAARRESPYDAPFDDPGDFVSNLLRH